MLFKTLDVMPHYSRAHTFIILKFLNEEIYRKDGFQPVWKIKYEFAYKKLED
jgi:hypothetical protein